MLRIRDVSRGSEFFPSRIPDPIFFYSGSRIRIKEFKYFKPKMISKLYEIQYDPGCSSRIRIPDPGFLPHPRSQIPDPGVKKAPDPGSWIRIRNTNFKIEIVTTLNTPCFTNLALNNTSVTTLYNRRGKECRLSTCPVGWAT